MTRSSYKPRPRMHSVWLSPARSRALMLTEIRDHADHGEVVQVIRAGGQAFQVIRNDTRFLTRSATGHPIATTDTVLEAVMAGDGWLDRVAEDAFDDDYPRGAA